MKKVLNILLLISFLITIMVPITGIHLHKAASVLFLMLSLIHTFIYRTKLGKKRVLLLVLVIVSFATGILGMIFERYPVILIMHRVVSIAVVFFMAIHIFVFHKRFSNCQ